MPHSRAGGATLFYFPPSSFSLGLALLTAMSKRKGHKSSTAPPTPPAVEKDAFANSWQRVAIRALLAVAMASALYLLYVSLSGSPVAGCGPDSGCDRVLRSRWAYWLGLPVSAPAFLAYGTLFALLSLVPRQGIERQRKLWAVLLSLAVMVIGAASWFVALMLFAIQGLCPFCLAAHGAAVAASVWLIHLAPIQTEPKSPAKREKLVYVAPALARRSLAAGLAAVAVLVGGQLAYKKPTHIIKSLDQPPPMLTAVSNPLPQLALTNAAPITTTTPTPPASKPATSSAPARIAQTTNPPATPTLPPPTPAQKGRVITTHNGAFQLAMEELPVMGSPDAPHVIVSLFDYTCHHCHIMHAHLRTALQYFSNRLAIISLPMPLDSTCNPLIRRTHPTASNACFYARLGLAVWRANRQRFQQFDDFMFSRPTPPPVSEASDYAANLVGADALGRALSDPWIDEHLRLNISLYQTNSLTLGTGAMPQLVIGNKAVSGSLNSPGELIRLLNEHLVKP